MSNMPTKVKMPLPSSQITSKSFTQEHVTTQQWFTPMPIFCRELIPNGHKKVKPFSRIIADPLVVPTFGRCTHHQRFFFVPFRTVWQPWNAMINNTIFNRSDGTPELNTSIPYIINYEFIGAFLTSLDQNDGWLATGSNADYDICINNNGNYAYYKLTDLGILALQLIESLGYKINWLLQDGFMHPAFPLLCYCKVLLDWYYPTGYVGSQEYNVVDSYMQRQNSWPFYAADIVKMVNFCLSVGSFEPDLYVNAFDKPTGPNSAQINANFSIKDITIPSLVATNPQYSSMVAMSDGTPFLKRGDDGAYYPQAVTQYIQNALRSLTDYTVRHQLAGVRVLDRMLAEYGVVLDSELLKRSMYLGQDKFELDFYEIMSHSDTANSGGAVLGAMAGKGEGYSNQNFELDFQNDEFGFLIGVSSIIPVSGIYEGQHPEKMHVSLFDFFHGDFDHMGTKPLPVRSVFVPQDGGNNDGYGVDNSNGINSQIWGYVPQYIEYNSPENLMTGLLRVRSKKGLLPSFNFLRQTGYGSVVGFTNIKHNIGFVQANLTGQQFNRIFHTKSGPHFIMYHNYEVENIDSTLPAYETYEFKHDENKKVQVQVNGTKVN